MQPIPESDWKIFRRVRTAALARYCERVLAEVARLACDTSIESHDRYLQVYKLIHERDKLMANTFNDFRRSTAELQLLIMKSHGMLTDEECAQFSPEIRAKWTALLER